MSVQDAATAAAGSIGRWPSKRVGIAVAMLPLLLGGCGGGSSGGEMGAAVASGSVSSAVPIVSASGASALPAQPGALTALNATSETLTLNWSAASGASGYKVYRNGTLVWTSPSAATTYVDAGLAPNAGYTYTVSAYNALGDSAPSAGVARNTTVVEAAGARVGYRFPTNAQRWNEFLKSPDGSFAFPIFDADPVNGSDRYDTATISPFIRPNLTAAHAQNRGLKVLGHIAGDSTPSGGAAVIKAKIDAWYAAFPDVDGIYVGDAGYAGAPGDAAARAVFVAFWADIAAYIHARGGLAVIHGGAPLSATLDSYPTQADLEDNNRQLLRYYETIAIYETDWTTAPNPSLYSWMTSNFPGDSYDYNFRFRYEIFANAVPASVLSQVANYFLSRNVGYLYLSDVDLSHAVSDGSQDPVDDPAYWGCVNSLLSTLASACPSGS